MSDKGDMPTARFIAAAREGWPEAIRRAMVAEQGMEEAEARLVADELEALDFLWQEYVQADPATLTEDAKELAAKVRQKVRELAGVEQLEARLAAIEAQAARMRRALTPFADAGTIAAAIGLGGGVLIGTIGNDAYELYVYHLYWARDALVSCSTGCETAERLRLLEELAEAATEFVERCRIVTCEARNVQEVCGNWDTCPVDRLEDAVQALKGGQSDAGTEA